MLVQNKKKLINYNSSKLLFQLFDTNNYFLITHKHFFSFEQIILLSTICNELNIEFFSPKLNLVKKITSNNDFKLIFKGPTLIFYSKKLSLLLKLFKNDIFKEFTIPLVLFKKPYLIDLNFFNKYILKNKFNNVNFIFLSFFYNFLCKFLLKFQFFIKLLFLKFTFIIQSKI